MSDDIENLPEEQSSNYPGQNIIPINIEDEMR
ncbi:MAG: hypothetical protein ACJAVY_002570, partial [Marinoscillum sp.]